MKDEKLFLETDFKTSDLIEVERLLKKNGWIINYKKNKMAIYESNHDLINLEPMCFNRRGGDYYDLLLVCLIDIQKYYKRVL